MKCEGNLSSIQDGKEQDKGSQGTHGNVGEVVAGRSARKKIVYIRVCAG